MVSKERVCAQLQNVLKETNVAGIGEREVGKVRDSYKQGDRRILVTTDRISAFDVIMDQGIPFKGQVLTAISLFWFEQMANLIPNHIVATAVDDFPAITHKYRDQLEGRSMLVKKAKPLPVECIVRGYISCQTMKIHGELCRFEIVHALSPQTRRHTGKNISRAGACHP